jgi:signal transduction histidine kinase
MTTGAPETPPGEAGRIADDRARVERLERRLVRERTAREEAEQIAERGMRELWQANRELENRVAQRTAELRRSLAAVTMATEAKERFLAELGHELTTPLHAVLGILELTDPATLDPANRDRFQAIREHSTRLAALLRGLVELAGAEGAPNPEALLERRPMEWLDEATAEWTKPAAIRGQLLVPTTLGRTAPTRADWARLRRMLDAVMSNATVHADPGAVGLTLDVTSDEITLTVSDSGPGMGEAEVATVLEPFVGYGSSSGVGIGLTIADRLAEAAGGSLELTSDEAGTTITMSLPLG